MLQLKELSHPLQQWSRNRGIFLILRTNISLLLKCYCMNYLWHSCSLNITQFITMKIKVREQWLSKCRINKGKTKHFVILKVVSSLFTAKEHLYTQGHTKHYLINMHINTHVRCHAHTYKPTYNTATHIPTNSNTTYIDRQTCIFQHSYTQPHTNVAHSCVWTYCIKKLQQCSN